MATTIRITLLSGRYGATPWGRSEHEGQVEYPPSPWPLLRAVLNGAFGLTVTPGQLPEGAEALITRLAEQPPSYHLPYGEYGQIRGFRPVYHGDRDAPAEAAGKLLEALRIVDGEERRQGATAPLEPGAQRQFPADAGGLAHRDRDRFRRRRHPRISTNAVCRRSRM